MKVSLAVLAVPLLLSTACMGASPPPAATDDAPVGGKADDAASLPLAFASCEHLCADAYYECSVETGDPATCRAERDLCTKQLQKSIVRGEETEVTLQCHDEQAMQATLFSLLGRIHTAHRDKRVIHPQGFGCVDATFTVDPDIDDDLAVGIFAEPGRQFDAVIRYSAGDPVDEKSHRELLSLGMAIKLFDTGLTNVLAPHTDTQDLLLVNFPVLIGRDVTHFTQAMGFSLLVGPDDDATMGPNAAQQEFLGGLRAQVRSQHVRGVLDALNVLGPQSQRVVLEHAADSRSWGSPVDASYFSMMPFQLGSPEFCDEDGCTPQAVKYMAKPCEGHAPVSQTDAVSQGTAEHFLDAGLAVSLADTKSTCVEFYIIRQGMTDQGLFEDGPHAEVIDDAITPWTAHEPERVAKIELTGPSDEGYCEDAHFTIGNASEPHLALGSLAEARIQGYRLHSIMPRNLFTGATYREGDRP